MIPENERSVSIIVPTYHEAQNIKLLVQRLSEVNFSARQFEVLIVDDNSQDGTADIINDLKKHYPWLQLITRLQNPGLSASVMEGIQTSQYANCIVMDADLSHPPEKIPLMLTVLAQEGVDLVVGSRYVKGGSSDEHWPLIRKIFSKMAALTARILVGTRVKDPLAGFLAFKKSTFQSSQQIKAIGWKIGLEIMVKCYCKNIQEIPIHFTQRVHGDSKLNIKVVFNFIKQMQQLAYFKLFAK